MDEALTQRVTKITAEDIPAAGALTLYAKWTAADPDNGGLSDGAIAGIVIGVVAALGIAGFAVYWFVIRKKKSAGKKA